MISYKCKNTFIPIKSALEKRELLINALFTRPKSLSKLLPYDEYIGDGNLFQMKDGSLGVVFEAELLEHEPLTSKQIIEAVEGLKPFFELPENCTLQFLYDQSALSPLDGKIKKMEQGFSEAHPVSRFSLMRK